MHAVRRSPIPINLPDRSGESLAPNLFHVDRLLAALLSLGPGGLTEGVTLDDVAAAYASPVSGKTVARDRQHAEAVAGSDGLPLLVVQDDGRGLRWIVTRYGTPPDTTQDTERASSTGKAPRTFSSSSSSQASPDSTQDTPDALTPAGWLLTHGIDVKAPAVAAITGQSEAVRARALELFYQAERREHRHLPPTYFARCVETAQLSAYTTATEAIEDPGQRRTTSDGAPETAPPPAEADPVTAGVLASACVFLTAVVSVLFGAWIASRRSR